VLTDAFGAIADKLETDWPSLARKEQLAPQGSWSIWMVLAGRGWGKTRTGAEWIRAQAEAGLASHIGLVGPTSADVRDVMVGTLLEIAPNSNRPLYEPSKRSLTWPNGCVAYALASEEPNRVRGFGFSIAWLDELCAWSNVNETFDLLQFTMRRGRRPRQVITTTPKPIPLLRQLLKRDDVVVTKGSTRDNIKNLAPTFLQTIVSRYEGSRLGRQELDAEILDDVIGALWSRDLLEQTRRATAPPMSRIVVAIDPSVSAGEGADEAGIVVAGLGMDGHGYILADESGVMAPIEWARRAVQLYKFWGADRVLAEVNNGGLLVEAQVLAVNRNVAFKAVHASRAKITRAEPCAALFEQNRCHLVGTFPQLEDELCTFSGGSSNSPGRLDAMVWGLTELQLNARRGEFVFAGGERPDYSEAARHPYGTDHYR
jgi:phage terminase large subunit-like protein